MRHTENNVIAFSSGIWDLMKKVPAKELESVLREAFPQYLSKPKAKAASKSNSAEDLKLLQEIHELATSSDPIDSVQATREVRKQSL
jgi:hypothetical protein